MTKRRHSDLQCSLAGYIPPGGIGFDRFLQSSLSSTDPELFLSTQEIGKKEGDRTETAAMEEETPSTSAMEHRREGALLLRHQRVVQNEDMVSFARSSIQGLIPLKRAHPSPTQPLRCRHVSPPQSHKITGGKSGGRRVTSSQL